MKKFSTLKKVISLFAVAALLVALMSMTAFAATASDAKASVVAVISQDGFSYGTGFALGKAGKPVEYIVTTNDVVRGELGNTTATVAFDLASNEMMLANVYYYSTAKNIAILELPKATDKVEAMVLCPLKNVDIDDTFSAIGYPEGQSAGWQKYNSNDITMTRGGVKNQLRIDGNKVYMLDLNLSINGGNEGGPLVNSKGQIVGMNFVGADGENYALAIDEILDVIDSEDIKVTLAGGINWLIIVGAVVLLAIVVLVVLLLVFRKGGKNEAPYTAPIDPNPATTPQAPVTPANYATARIIALGGALNGKKFSVTGSAKMGRDASRCTIAFPVNTQGVSAAHCELTFDGTVFYVKDLGSSYGTFTNDGTKLAANVPQMLNSGDKFYLASPENTFEVRF